MLVATQNPIDIAGTYGLGEGALDRFPAVVTPGRASAASELEVLTGRRGRPMLDAVEPVATLTELIAAREVVATVQITDAVAAYVVELLDAIRNDPRVRVGPSTRGGVAIVALARAFAALDGRNYVTADDVVRASVPRWPTVWPAPRPPSPPGERSQPSACRGSRLRRSDRGRRRTHPTRSACRPVPARSSPRGSSPG